MKRALIAIFSGALAFSAMAQSTPVGLWRSFDDKSGEAKAEVRIAETAGVLSGKIEKRLLKTVKPEDVCTECSDDRKDQPILGLEIIRGAKKAESREVWEGGKILDPENGRNYTLNAASVSISARLPLRAVRISVAVSGNSLAK